MKHAKKTITKTIYLLLSLIVSTEITSQTLTKKGITNVLQGKWELVYQSEIKQADTTRLFEKRIYDFSGKRATEIGYWKNGQITRTAVKWSLLKEAKDNNYVLTFVGGIWTDQQGFVIKEITRDKITMLSCDKYENCDEVYFIKR